MNRFALAPNARPALALSLVLLACLTACGGGSNPDQTTQPSAAPADSSTAASTDATVVDTSTLDSTVAAALATTEAQPSYHMAPVLLDEPDAADVGGTNTSAHQTPRSFRVDGDATDIDTARLTRETLSQRLANASRSRIASAGSGASTAPQATAIIGAVHTPAQIRAAYGLPALPAAGAAISPSVAATLGAGQTIYIIDAYHDATALSDLNAFSTKFGLPTCSNVAIAATAKLPLAAAPASCTFSAVTSTAAGGMTATVPAYNGTWAPESKLDVQWAHAIAPLARIVLIEMPSSLSTDILGANLLSAKMGPGVVSMSFGSAEASWSSTVDRYFVGAGMTYVAAAGDSGSQVLWPAVSPNVVAVGGTSLNWSGTGTRYEAAWAKTGGGMSAYEALPSWQSGVIAAGGGTVARRAVPDVSFNANPMTGEYVALTLPGKATVWSAYGGTSIAAPQWAGVIAVANAMRASNGKATLGDIHATLYKSIAAVPGTYAASFGDVVDGTNGTCATCRAGTGFDQATGWGTPNSAKLLETLSGVSSTTPTATITVTPVVPGGSFSGQAGTALSQSLGVTVPAGASAVYAVSGAPSGLTVDASGTLKWASPVAGSYSFKATATAGGKSATGSYALTIAAASTVATNHAPTLASATYSGKANAEFATMLAGKDVDGGSLTYTASGAPSGFTVTVSGFVYWVKPVKGTYRVTVTAHDNKGATGSAVMTLVVS